ncbi:hypothetical protein [Gordonia malaquae]|uniref:hypothetical protein n=1 Tax=Gordonia malaquae TaxID=410332 RepID=UPI00301B5F72
MSIRHIEASTSLGQVTIVADVPRGETTTSLTGYAGGLERKQALVELDEPAPAVAGRLF